MLNNHAYLYIEDDSMSREVMNMIMKNALQVERFAMFEDSDRFTERLYELPFIPDLIFVDIHMKPIDGFEMLEVINTEALIPHTVRIILSNRGQSADIARGQALGVSGYIVKANTTPTEVIGRVSEILANKKI